MIQTMPVLRLLLLVWIMTRSIKSYSGIDASAVSIGVSAFTPSLPAIVGVGRRRPVESIDATTTNLVSSSTDAPAPVTARRQSCFQPERQQSTMQYCSRHGFIMTTVSCIGGIFGTCAIQPVASAVAASDDPASAATAALEAVRNEVYGANGGISYLTTAIDQGDFASLLDFTKTYDPLLRKSILKRAKQLILTKDDAVQNEQATQLSNAVTFDLIGINKSARPGQESQDKASQYLFELKDDLKRYIALLESKL